MIKKKKVKWGDFVFDPSTQEAGHPWFIEEPCLNKSKLKINKKRKKKLKWRRGLFWLMASEVLLPGQLALRVVLGPVV